MKALKCDDCGEYFEMDYRGAYYFIRDCTSCFYTLNGDLDLCPKCWNKMLKEITPDLGGKE